jgi:hypothetical protein
MDAVGIPYPSLPKLAAARGEHVALRTYEASAVVTAALVQGVRIVRYLKTARVSPAQWIIDLPRRARAAGFRLRIRLSTTSPLVPPLVGTVTDYSAYEVAVVSASP